MSEHNTNLVWEPHHVLYEAAAWESNTEASKLRNLSGLIVPMYIQPHDQLHNEISLVPLLDSIQVYYIKKTFKTYSRDYIGNLNRLIESVHESKDRFEYDPIRSGVSDFTILALEKQIPFIKEGVYKEKNQRKERRQKFDRRPGGSVC